MPVAWCALLTSAAARAAAAAAEVGFHPSVAAPCCLPPFWRPTCAADMHIDPGQGTVGPVQPCPSSCCFATQPLPVLLLPLPADTKNCFGTCTNTYIDINHCGGCGRTCDKPPMCRTATGATCKYGKCSYPINPGASCTTPTGSTSGICQADGKCVGEWGLGMCLCIWLAGSSVILETALHTIHQQ